MILSGTGHRPNRLGGYNKESVEKLFTTAIKTLTILQPEEVISGFALGWDMALATAAIELSIPLHAAIPFKGQEAIWPKESKDLYFKTLDKANKVVEVCEPGYAAWKMMKRNQYMNIHADEIAALWDSQYKDGGTFQCIKDAVGRKKIIWNSWGIFQSISDSLHLITENDLIVT
jgi:uncharacterized phage-like protein YoqJ